MLHWSPRLVALVAVLALVLSRSVAWAKSSPTTSTGKRVMTRRVLPPTRVLAVIAPVCAAGFGVACAAAVSFAVTPHKTATLLGLAALLAASTLADRFPVPVEGIDTGGVSLSFVFGVASIVLFGWAAGLIVVCLAPAITQVLERRPPHAGRLQRLGRRARRDRRGRRLGAPERRRRQRRARPRGRGRLGAVRGQPAADHRRRRGQRAPLALLAGAARTSASRSSPSR